MNAADELHRHYAAVRARLGVRPTRAVFIRPAPTIAAPVEPETAPEPVTPAQAQAPIRLAPGVVETLTPTGRWRKILRETVEETGVSFEQMCAITRNQKVVTARRVAAFRLRNEAGWSFPKIGALFGRDHTSVLNWLNPKAQRRKNDDRQD